MTFPGFPGCECSHQCDSRCKPEVCPCAWYSARINALLADRERIYAVVEAAIWQRDKYQNMPLHPKVIAALKDLEAQAAGSVEEGET